MAKRDIERAFAQQATHRRIKLDNVYKAIQGVKRAAETTKAQREKPSIRKG